MTGKDELLPAADDAATRQAPETDDLHLAARCGSQELKETIERLICVALLEATGRTQPPAIPSWLQPPRSKWSSYLRGPSLPIAASILAVWLFVHLVVVFWNDLYFITTPSTLISAPVKQLNGPSSGGTTPVHVEVHVDKKPPSSSPGENND